MADLRARPLTENYQNKLEPEQRVVVTAKNIRASRTILLNGLLFAGAAFIQIFDILLGANVLEPIIKVFTQDPGMVAGAVTVLTQLYSAANIYLRIVTKQPITFKNN